jgi:hypothetical protein
MGSSWAAAGEAIANRPRQQRAAATEKALPKQKVRLMDRSPEGAKEA